MDLRQNKYDSTRVVTFTTGAPVPTLHLKGRVWDWSTARPVAAALLVAVLLPDSLPYRMLSDSSGRFDFGPLPSGEYLFYAGMDQNRNNLLDRREAFDSVRLPPDSTAVPELWVFPHDSQGPRLSKAAPTDSLSASLTFTQPLDPKQRFTPGAVHVLLLPDSIRVEVVSLLPKAEHDSLYAPPPPPVDTTAPKPAPKPVPLPTKALAVHADSVRPSREPLATVLLLRVREAWRPGARYVVQVDSMRNANGAVADARGPLEIPKPKADSTAAGADSAKAAPAKPKKK